MAAPPSPQTPPPPAAQGVSEVSAPSASSTSPGDSSIVQASPSSMEDATSFSQSGCDVGYLSPRATDEDNSAVGVDHVAEVLGAGTGDAAPVDGVGWSAQQLPADSSPQSTSAEANVTLPETSALGLSVDVPASAPSSGAPDSLEHAKSKGSHQLNVGAPVFVPRSFSGSSSAATSPSSGQPLTSQPLLPLPMLLPQHGSGPPPALHLVVSPGHGPRYLGPHVPGGPILVAGGPFALQQSPVIGFLSPAAWQEQQQQHQAEVQALAIHHPGQQVQSPGHQPQPQMPTVGMEERSAVAGHVVVPPGASGRSEVPASPSPANDSASSLRSKGPAGRGGQQARKSPQGRKSPHGRGNAGKGTAPNSGPQPGPSSSPAKGGQRGRSSAGHQGGLGAQHGGGHQQPTGVQGGGKRSGSGNEEAAQAYFQGLSAEEAETLKASILRQVEYYFSDTNLPGDAHLQKLIHSDAEGFVSLKAILDFKKMKSLVPAVCVGTAAYTALVASSLAASSALVVNEQGSKARRSAPLPKVDADDLKRRTVIAENLPGEPSVKAVEELFAKAGRVRSVRIRPPEGVNNAQNSKKKVPYAHANKLHALVEFETIEEAEQAVSLLNNEDNWRTGLHVKVLLPRAKKQGHGQGNHAHGGHLHSHPQAHNHHGHPRKSPPPPTPPAPGGAAGEDGPGAGAADSSSLGSTETGGREEREPGEGAVSNPGTGSDEAQAANTQPAGGAAALGARKGRSGRGKGKGPQKGGKGETHSASPSRSSPARQHLDYSATGRQGSPLRAEWVGSPGIGHGNGLLQGMAHQGHRNSPLRGRESSGGPDSHLPHVNKAPPVPRMPDGTRGFTMGRGRPLAPAPAP